MYERGNKFPRDYKMKLKWAFIIGILMAVMFFQACPPPAGCGFNGNDDEEDEEEGEYNPYDNNDKDSCGQFLTCFDETYECIILAGNLDNIDICIEKGLQCLIFSDSCTSNYINCTIGCENEPVHQVDNCVFDCTTDYLGCITNCGWEVVCFFDCVAGVDDCVFGCDIADWSCIHGCYKDQYYFCSGKCF